jgi:putative ABC transport system permease protein
MTWAALIWKNLFRRPARTIFTAAGVGLGVGLIVALLAITNGVHRTAADLMHVGRADFGLYQAEVSDFTRSLLPESLAAKVARDPSVAGVSKVKLLVVGGTLVAGARGSTMVGDRSGKKLGESFRLLGRSFTVVGIYHSGDRFEDLGIVLPLHVAEALARRRGEITSIGVTVRLGASVKSVAARLERRYPGVAAITEPGQAIKVDTSSRLIISTGWIVSLLALIVGGIGVMNTMAMSVFERTREIGILRAVGWSDRRVAMMIVSEAVAISLLALAVGCALGVIGAELFVGRSGLSGLINPTYTATTFVWGLAFALLVAVIGAFYPAWRAVKLAPIVALRHE